MKNRFCCQSQPGGVCIPEEIKCSKLSKAANDYGKTYKPAVRIRRMDCSDKINSN